MKLSVLSVIFSLCSRYFNYERDFSFKFIDRFLRIYSAGCFANDIIIYLAGSDLVIGYVKYCY